MGHLAGDATIETAAETAGGYGNRREGVRHTIEKIVPVYSIAVRMNPPCLAPAPRQQNASMIWGQ